jgi:hypothetical protein
MVRSRPSPSSRPKCGRYNGSWTCPGEP